MNCRGFSTTLFYQEKNGPAKRGYVQAVYEELCTEKQPASFFLCGWKAMIDEAKQRIQTLGYDRKAIHQELYG